MTVDLSNISIWMQVLQMIAIVLLWLRKPGQDASEALTKFKTDAAEADAELKGRVDVLAERVNHMPTSDELREVEGQLVGIKAEMGSLKDAVTATRSGVNRIENWLMHERTK